MTANPEEGSMDRKTYLVEVQLIAGMANFSFLAIVEK
jgi:hypothetical protein